jgi:FixJ family two-component response regulator
VTGRDLAEQLHAKSPWLKVIFMSGYSAEVLATHTEFFRRTGSYFLHKPCAAATLIRTVRQCLDAKVPDGVHG